MRELKGGNNVEVKGDSECGGECVKVVGRRCFNSVVLIAVKGILV